MNVLDEQSKHKKNKYMDLVEESYISLENSELFLDLMLYSVRHHIDFSKSPSVYEAGFGTGFYFKHLVRDRISSYTGIDLDMTCAPKILNFANANEFPNISLLETSSLDVFDKSLGDFDIVLSISSLYAKNYSELLLFLKHMYSAVKKEGVIVIIVIHADYTQSTIRKDTLENVFNIYIKPDLEVGETYANFSEINYILDEPYFETRFENKDYNEYVLSREVFLNACRESQLWVNEVPFVATPGKEHLLDLVTAVNKRIYILKK